MDRLVNFSDAVIAIAVTILVLPLVDKASELHVDSFSSLINGAGQQFLVFSLSFVVICSFWLVHHQLLRSLQSFNQTIFWLNALWLFSIVVIPFPTELLGKVSNNISVVSVFYIVNLLITVVAGILISLAINKSPDLQKPGSGKLSSAPGILAIGILCAVLIIIVLFPGIGLWALLLLFIIGPATNLFKKYTLK